MATFGNRAAFQPVLRSMRVSELENQFIHDTPRKRPVVTDLGIFGKEWLKSPLRVAAIAPSSVNLGRAMTNGLPAAGGPVVELGPGTGVFTTALLKRGIPAGSITAIELGRSFAATMAVRYPEVTVIQGNAVRVSHLVPRREQKVSAVVCGLSLLSMPPDKILRMLAGCFRIMGEEGTFRTFTYALRCPVPQSILDRLGLVARRTAFVPLNIPPAAVYVVSRKPRQ